MIAGSKPLTAKQHHAATKWHLVATAMTNPSRRRDQIISLLLPLIALVVTTHTFYSTISELQLTITTLEEKLSAKLNTCQSTNDRAVEICKDAEQKAVSGGRVRSELEKEIVKLQKTLHSKMRLTKRILKRMRSEQSTAIEKIKGQNVGTVLSKIEKFNKELDVLTEAMDRHERLGDYLKEKLDSVELPTPTAKEAATRIVENKEETKVVSKVDLKTALSPLLPLLPDEAHVTTKNDTKKESVAGLTEEEMRALVEGA